MSYCSKAVNRLQFQAIVEGVLACAKQGHRPSNGLFRRSQIFAPVGLPKRGQYARLFNHMVSHARQQPLGTIPTPATWACGALPTLHRRAHTHITIVLVYSLALAVRSVLADTSSADTSRVHSPVLAYWWAYWWAYWSVLVSPYRWAYWWAYWSVLVSPYRWAYSWAY
jgi:hypothetical protein